MRHTGSAPANAPQVRFPKTEFFVLFLPLTIIVLVAGFSFASMSMEARMEEMRDRDGTRLYLVSGFIGAEVFGSLHHLRALAVESSTSQALNSSDSRHLSALQSSFLTLARRNPLYQQIRWIDELGMEKIRVNRDQGEPYVVAPKELQNKSSRYYFGATNNLRPGELYISPVDLNMEHGIIESPARPVLRVATPVKDKAHNRRGIIVLNISMKHLFEIADMPGQAGDKADFLLLNQNGILLHGRVNFSSASDVPKQSLSYAEKRPTVWKSIVAADSGSIEDRDGLWTWKTLSPVKSFSGLAQAFPEDDWGTLEQLIFDDFSLTLIAHRSVQALQDIRRESRMLASLGVALTLSLFGFSLYYYLSGHVRARRAELRAAQAIEREAHLARMKELEERFHRLVEASSIGQLVVARDGTIEIGNQAAAEMLGYDRHELEGMLVDDLVPAELRTTHARKREAFMWAPEARRMGEGRELEAVRKDGVPILVEIGLNPYTDKGQQRVLVNIVDLSGRRNRATLLAEIQGTEK